MEQQGQAKPRRTVLTYYKNFLAHEGTTFQLRLYRDKLILAPPRDHRILAGAHRYGARLERIASLLKVLLSHHISSAHMFFKMEIKNITTQKINPNLYKNIIDEKVLSNCFEWVQNNGPVTTRVDLQKPSTGMSFTANGTLFSTLRILVPEPFVTFKDGWIREHDATGIYAINDARQLQTSVLWRLQSPWCPAKDLEKSMTAEFIVSNQTLREQSDGALAMECTVLATSVRTARWSMDTLEWETKPTALRNYRRGCVHEDVTVQCVLFELPGLKQNMALFARSDEIHHITLTATTTEGTDAPKAREYVLKSHFFPTIIEKGVLHRGRFLAVLGPPQAEKDWCSQTAGAFSQQPPLLQ
mgnify:FL=1